MTVRSVVAVVVVVGVAYCALMVGAAAAISWVIAPRVYSVDPTVEQQVMKDLEPWSDEVMAIEGPPGTTLNLDAGVVGCLYDDSTQTAYQPNAGIYWQGPYDPLAAENGPGRVARSEFGLLVDRLEALGWRVGAEGLVEGADALGPSRMEAVLTRGSGDDLVRLELTTYGWEYGAVLTLPHAPQACRVDVEWP
ncbi:hypothetical protein ACIA03_12240 [Nocardioides sp. NPDC051685]|uniref:hypothetical protein n=1 Tax=Nocardioides sp. NPDC051685 TaxID=3364334 RepID=UPI0037BE0F3F